MQKLLVLGISTLLLAFAMPADAGKLYKWVDEDGKVHYTDTPPPEASTQERQILNEQGMVTETLERQKTPEEIAAIEAEEERKRLEAEAAAEKAAHDKALLQTYTNVEQLEMTRDGRLNAIDSQINVVGSSITALERQVADLEQRAAQLKNNDKPIPENLSQQIEDVRAELLNNQRYLLRKQEERQATIEQYDEEIKRFKELRGEAGL